MDLCIYIYGMHLSIYRNLYKYTILLIRYKHTHISSYLYTSYLYISVLAFIETYKYTMLIIRWNGAFTQTHTHIIIHVHIIYSETTVGEFNRPGNAATC